MIILVILLLRGSTLHNYFFVDHNYLPGVIFLVCICVVIVLYFATCKDPGYLPINPDGYQLRVKIDDEHHDTSTETSDNVRSDSNSSSDNNNHDHASNETTFGAVLSNLTEPRPNETSEDHPLHLCSVCNIHQPLRTKHCNDCERCVSRYDHHCFFVGTCVGQKNHFVFWVFLMFQSFVIVWAFVMALEGFIASQTVSGWVYTNGLILVTTVVLFFMFFMPFGLWLFHTYLMLTNQTTWEVSKRHKISYLQELPEEEFPFDNGCISNICEFYQMQSLKLVWLVPENIKNGNNNKKFNIWVNQYWSCF